MTLLAAAAYLVTTGVVSVRGRKVRRAWHVRLFTLTVVVTVLAAVLSFPNQWLRGVVLLGALAPLVLLPFVGTPVRKQPKIHALVALAAAPFYLAAVWLWAVGTSWAWTL